MKNAMFISAGLRGWSRLHHLRRRVVTHFRWIAFTVIVCGAALDVAADCGTEIKCLQVVTVTTNVVKRGFLPFIKDPGNPTIYLQKKLDYHYKTVEDNTGYDELDQAFEQHDKDTYDASWSDTFVYLNATDGPVGTNYTGTYTHTWDYLNRYLGTNSGSTSSTRDSTTGAWSGTAPGNYAGGGSSPTVTADSWSSSGDFAWEITANTNRQVVSFAPDPWWDSSYGPDYYFNMYSYDRGTLSFDDESSLQIHLSNPISVSTFASSFSGDLASASWPDWGTASSSGAAQNGGLSVLGDGDVFAATFSKMKYRIKFFGKPGSKIDLYWFEKFVPAATNASVVYTPREAHLVCDGSEDQATSEYEVPMPSAAGSTTVIGIRMSACSQVGCEVGNFTTEQGSVFVKVPLGNLSSDESAGLLYVYEENPGAGLGTPSTLKAFVNNGVKVLRSGGTIRQVNSPRALVDVVAVTGSKYELRFYPSGTSIGTDGLYAVSGSPLTTVTIQNPDGDADRVRISTTASARVDEFAWSEDDQGWDLNQAGGLRKQFRSKTVVDDIRTQTDLIRGDDDEVVSREYRRWKMLGGTVGDVLIQESFGAEGSEETTAWTYYDDAVNDGLAFGQLKSVVHPDGSWIRYEYDEFGRHSKDVSGFLNAGPTADESDCRVNLYSYESYVTGDDITVQTNTARRVIEKLLGTEVARTYRGIKQGETREIRCAVPGAAWDNTNNLVTITTERGWPGYNGQMTRVVRPDGTAQISLEATRANGSAAVNMVMNGQPDGTGTNIVDGTRTVTMVGTNGQTISRTTYDIASGIVLDAETYAYDGNFRQTSVAYLDGTVRAVTYDCCGTASETARDGTTTSYSHDLLGRTTGTTSAGLVANRDLDADGKVRATTRPKTGGGTILINRSAYDLAGRVTSSMDAFSNVTYYAESVDGNGQRTRTTTYPDTSTHVELSARDGQTLSVTGSSTFPVRYVYGVEAVNSVNRRFRQEIKLTTNNTDTAEWVKTYTDALGRDFLTVYSDSSTEQSFYNRAGQLVKTVDPDGVATLMAYNGKGEMEYSAIDINTNGVIDLAGNDRVTQTVADVAATANGNVRRVRTYAWQTASTDAGTLIGTVETSVNSSQTWQTVGDASSSMLTEYPGSGVQRMTQTAPDGSVSISISQYGRPLSVVQRASSSGGYLNELYFGYDEYGRQSGVTNARNGATTFTYNDGDQLVTTTTPSPGGGGSAQSTTNVYDNMGRVIRVLLPDGGVITNSYYANGLLQRTAGSRTYPVAYTYDGQGRMATMTTWQGYAGNSGAATTSWSYHTNRGWMVAKRYQDSHGPDYAYSAAGRLQTRTWARGTPRLSTAYSYNGAGDLAGVNYSDTTPDVTYGYTRMGQVASIAQDGASTILNGYTALGQLSSQGYSTGPANGLSVNYDYDNLNRRSGLRLRQGLMTPITQSYSWLPGNRLSSVGDSTERVVYAYRTNSPAVARLTYQHRADTASAWYTNLVSDRLYDHLNRLTNITSTTTSTNVPKLGFSYAYNSANQRIQVTQADGSYWAYTYDNLGQVVSGKRYWADNTPVAGQQYEYGFDDIGNRTSAKAGGNDAGSGLRTASYTPNLLNQYSNRTVAGYIDVVGQVVTNATVTVNGESAYLRADYFWHALEVTNTSAPWAGTVTVTATAGTNSASATGVQRLAKATEAFTHDLDGNLTADSQWNYTWDAENRLIQVESTSGVGATYKRKLEFGYDALGRRVQKKVWYWSTGSSAWVASQDTQFIYDGWNLVGEIVTNTLVRSYLWGSDMSGSLQGAGGVGGLLLMREGNRAHYAAYDGNGNVAGLVESRTGKWSARYEYGPFGELIRATGQVAHRNPFRFSTKYQDEETGLLYYGYRYYDPNTGRWLSRDPLCEGGGLNLIGFVFNNPNCWVDRDGLDGVAVDGYDFWADAGGEGMAEGGVWGYMKAGGAVSMMAIIDFWGARDVEENAEKAGTAAGEGKHCKGALYGVVVTVQIAASAIPGEGKVVGAVEQQAVKAIEREGIDFAEKKSIAVAEKVATKVNGVVEQRRNALGQWVKKNAGDASPGALAEKEVWDAIEKKDGWSVIRGRVTMKDAAGNTRVYDGVAISPSGKKIGLEVKSSESAAYKNSQKAFDEAVNSSRGASATGANSKGVSKIDRVKVIRPSTKLNNR